MFYILSWGGIGDTLRNLGLVPHQFLYRKFGVRCRVVRRAWRPGENPVPPESLYREIVERCSSLQWAGEVHDYSRYQRIPTRALREVIKLRNTRHYFPFDLRLTEEERKGIPMRATDLVVGIQTHLSGIHTKEWGIGNWQTCLDALLSATTDVSFVLIDPCERADQLCTDPRIRSTRGLNIIQSIAIVQQMDLLVSIDSWAKYVAACHQIPQVVVVPSQREIHSPEYLARNSFEGIFNQPFNSLIGLTGTKRRPQTTLDKMSDLDPLELAQHTLKMIAKIRRDRLSVARK